MLSLFISTLVRAAVIRRADVPCSDPVARTELLRDESSPVDLVGPSLPIVKMLCERGTRQDELEILPKVLNGVLSACLQNVEGLR